MFKVGGESPLLHRFRTQCCFPYLTNTLNATLAHVSGFQSWQILTYAFPCTGAQTYTVSVSRGAEDGNGDGSRPFRDLEQALGATPQDQDRVFVFEAGTYRGVGNILGNEPAIVLAKSLTLRSLSSAGITVFDCEGAERGFLTLLNSLSAPLHMEGFTLRNCRPGTYAAHYNGQAGSALQVPRLDLATHHLNTYEQQMSDPSETDF